MHERVIIKTFGCQMNDYETLRIRKLLDGHGFHRADTYANATVILFNTCTVRQKAEDKIYSELGRVKPFKKKNPSLLVGIGGCLAQQEGDRLLKKFPHIDFVFGTRSLPRLIDIIEKARLGQRLADIEMPDCFGDFYAEQHYRPDENQVSALLTVMQGCDNFCSYCIVPYVRGREWSRPADDVISEARSLVQSGVRDIMLLGQNVNSYGKHLIPAISFSELIERLSAIAGLERIRFTTSHPKDLSDELISAFATVPKLCPHIHLPLQSGSDRILQHMNRNYTSQDYIDKIEKLRDAVPDIALTSDIIVGYPGETEEEFQDTADIISEIQFDDLFIFHYTDRAGTKASEMPDNIPYPVKIQRLEKLNAIQRSVSLRKNSDLIGTKQVVLFEKHSKRDVGYISGRTRSAKVVNCAGPESMLGQLATVLIEKATIHSLTGKIV